MSKAYLLIGGNLGNRPENLSAASLSISNTVGSILRSSSLYETAAWGNEDQPDFLNQVLEIETQLTPTALLSQLLFIEKELGRVRNKKNDPRIIDLDILLYEYLVISDPLLQIPHPRLQERRFVLVPLSELIPSYIHPVLHLSIATLLEYCRDPLNVKKFSW